MVKVVVCPICNNLSRKLFRPFCSESCRDIDLGKWFTENYRVPTYEPLMAVNSDIIKVDDE